MLERYNINIQDYRAQAYYGASTMQREAKGATAITKKEERQADSVQC